MALSSETSMNWLRPVTGLVAQPIKDSVRMNSVEMRINMSFRVRFPDGLVKRNGELVRVIIGLCRNLGDRCADVIYCGLGAVVIQMCRLRCYG